MTIEVRVPTLGESVTEATVATWFKKPGDAVAVDEMLCELETDKVTVEVPAPAAGVMGDIVAKEGETVGVNALLATITAGEGAAAAPAAPAAAAPAASSGGSVDVMVPTLGESVTEATVSTWFKKVGDSVAQDEMLCELETDKVSVEVPAPASGVLTEIVAAEGATVNASAKLAVISGSASGASPAPAAPAAAVTPAVATGKDIANAPSAEKAMAEAGITPAQVTGTGRDGRIMKEDVTAAVAAAAAAPAPAAAAPAPAAAPRAPALAEDAAREERVRMTRLRQTIARRLKDAQNTAAILTTYNEVDMTEVMALRNTYKDAFEKKHGVRMGFMSFFTKACCHALKEVPEVNAEIDGQDIVYKNYVHMGVAAGTPQGLVVPVIRDADQMSFAEIEKAIA
ncbi:biotin/lipoyl-containing protein, partial [Ruegeria pomeroyi]